MAGIRLTGMSSGLDTESIIKQLVEAKSTKVTTLKKQQTKLEWKQTAWSNLNTKLKNLVSGTLGNLRFTDGYTKKTTTASNANAVSVTASSSAMNSVQTLRINQLAKSGYMTGSEMKASNGEKVTSGSNVMKSLGIAEGSFEIQVGEDSKTINIDETTTISSLVSSLKEAGVDAKFDASTQRLFIASTASGKDSDFKITGNQTTLEALGLGLDAKKIDGVDAEIELNGAIFTSSTNIFEINGMTIEAKQVVDEDITLTTGQDTSAIYDMLKKFMKEYNALINEMDKLYNADSTRGLEPLSDEEKEAMSESEIETLENKIKDSLLKGDTTLSSVSSAMKSIMSGGAEVNGKKLYLSDFGINTLGYFNAATNEKNAYHIDGDADATDASVQTADNKLLAAIQSDPDSVISFFTELSRSLYTKLNDMMKMTEFSSSMTVYDDKKMKEEYNDYTTKIAEAQEKLNAYEDKWYSKFSAMETALSKLESSSSAVTALLGS